LGSALLGLGGAVCREDEEDENEDEDEDETENAQ
jgi:hypothetical protein